MVILITNPTNDLQVLGQFRVNADQCYYSEAKNTSNFPKNRYTTVLAGNIKYLILDGGCNYYHRMTKFLVLHNNNCIIIT